MNKPFAAPVVIDAYRSSTTGVALSATDGSSFHHSLLDEKPEVFSYRGYHTASQLPVAVPTTHTSILDTALPRCLDMPLRLSGQKEYRLPIEWKVLQPLLEDLIAVEHEHNPNWSDYHTYLTIDCRDVSASEQQRRGGLHVDGFQGERINPKTKITRNYVLTTNGGTRFYPQPFKVLDPSRFNVFQGFDLQAKEPMLAEENTVYFMDAYTVHESGLASRDGRRTFLRLTYDLKKFDRLGNTHNSLLDYNWEMLDRDVHNTVSTPSPEDLNNPEYLI